MSLPQYAAQQRRARPGARDADGSRLRARPRRFAARGGRDLLTHGATVPFAARSTRGAQIPLDYGHQKIQARGVTVLSPGSVRRGTVKQRPRDSASKPWQGLRRRVLFYPSMASHSPTPVDCARFHAIGARRGRPLRAYTALCVPRLGRTHRRGENMSRKIIVEVTRMAIQNPMVDMGVLDSYARLVAPLAKLPPDATAKLAGPGYDLKSPLADRVSDLIRCKSNAHRG